MAATPPPEDAWSLQKTLTSIENCYLFASIYRAQQKRVTEGFTAKEKNKIVRMRDRRRRALERLRIDEE